MILWAAFLPDLRPHLPGCPQVMMEHELRRVAQDFFGRTRAWQVVTDPIAVPAGSPDVAIVLPDADTELVRVENAWYDNRVVDVMTSDQLDDYTYTDWRSQEGTPSALLQTTPGSVRLYPSPIAAADIGLRLRVAVRPGESGTGIPDDLYVLYREAIAMGVKSRLMMYPAAPWANPDLSGVNAMGYQREVARATLHAQRSFGKGRIPSRPRWC